MELGSYCRQAALAAPDEVAIRGRVGDFTWSDIAEGGDVFADWLRSSQVGDGDRVAVVLANSADMVSVLVGISMVGAIAVPIEPRMDTTLQLAAFQDAQPTVAIVSGAAVGIRDVLESAQTSVPSLRAVSYVAGSDDLTPPAEGRSTSEPMTVDVETEGWEPGQLEGVAFVCYSATSRGQLRSTVLREQQLDRQSAELAKVSQLATGDEVLLDVPLCQPVGLQCLMTAFALRATIVLSLDIDPKTGDIDWKQYDSISTIVGSRRTFAAMPDVDREGVRPFPATRFLLLVDRQIDDGVLQQLQKAWMCRLAFCPVSGASIQSAPPLPAV